MINELKPNQIFCFGSNAQGAHGAGAAKQAHDNHWTKWGHSKGLMWQSFAIDTMDGKDVFETGLKDLAITARCNPSLEFLLTPVGTGIAGYTIEQLEAMMPEMPSNVIKLWEVTNTLKEEE